MSQLTWQQAPPPQLSTGAQGAGGGGGGQGGGGGVAGEGNSLVRMRSQALGQSAPSLTGLVSLDSTHRLRHRPGVIGDILPPAGY